MTLPNFDSIESYEMLVQFLKEQATQHDWLFHFTRIECLLAILETKKWKLSKLKGMNDLHELQKSAAESQNTPSATCFSFGDEDNFAMWERYAVPTENGIRIAIPINNFSTITLNASIYLSDIVYYQGYTRAPLDHEPFFPKRLLWSNKEIKYFEDWTDQQDNLAGVIKNSAWKHEDETRLICTDGNTEIDLPDSFFENWIVSYGPGVNDQNNFLRLIREKYPNININQSYFISRDSGKRVYSPRT